MSYCSIHSCFPRTVQEILRSSRNMGENVRFCHGCDNQANMFMLIGKNPDNLDKIALIIIWV